MRAALERRAAGMEAWNRRGVRAASTDCIKVVELDGTLVHERWRHGGDGDQRLQRRAGCPWPDLFLGKTAPDKRGGTRSHGARRHDAFRNTGRHLSRHSQTLVCVRLADPWPQRSGPASCPYRVTTRLSIKKSWLKKSEHLLLFVIERE